MYVQVYKYFTIYDMQLVIKLYFVYLQNKIIK